MKNIFIVFFILALGITFPKLIDAQPLEIDLKIKNPEANVLYIGDLDFLSLGNVPDIFSLSFNNLSTETLEMSFKFELLVNSTPIVSAQSSRFLLPIEDDDFINKFSNQQLNSGAAFIKDENGVPTGEIIELNNYNVNFDRVQNLKDQVISTGKLPSGQYNFFVEATIFNQNVTPKSIIDNNPNDNILTISNPTTLELLYPGNRVGEEIVTEIPTPFPYFLWQSDATKFNLFVFERYAEDQSIQDVLSHDPMLHLEGYPNQVFQYPTDPSPLTFYKNGELVGNSVGPVRLLEPGNIYYWYVQAVIITASGENTLNTEVYQFKVSAQDQASAAGELIMTYLRQILGDRFEQYLQRLQGYEPTGNILLNNVPVDFDVLAELIQKINQNKAEIQNITIE